MSEKYASKIGSEKHNRQYLEEKHKNNLVNFGTVMTMLSWLANMETPN